jgi:cytoskeletal protein CcmA (bactofilin family)
MTEKAAASGHAPAAAKNTIAHGTVIEGNIITDGELQLDGTVKGDIRTNGRLIVSDNAFVEGNIFASQADVAGRITGTVECSGLLVIKASCIINGDIITKSLNVESGSTFDGRCKVGATSRNAPTDRKESMNPNRHPEMNGKSKNGAPAAEPVGASSSALL